MTEQNIWICRHGNRIDFVNPRWSEENPHMSDNPHLSDDGIIQAQETGRHLRGKGIRHIFASPFLRTIQTAHYIAEELDLQVHIEHGACEWLNPEWFQNSPQHQHLKNIQQQFPRVTADYESQINPSYPESDHQATQRGAQTIQKLAALYSNDFLVVGHGHSVHAMANGLIEEDAHIIGGLCALIKISRQEERYTLELNGDSSHLSGSESHSDKFN